ncbi:FKBP-type peptidyl-prolyl cis-trans isomerase 2 protein [Mycoavidus cysteinexigens]|uniref:peptidylprolyl isomerase n=2 Tax=Mycoavidus cysteinexigens TaxID=1553431 RepID=A0A2Z6EV66_9BURK|nr:FKBP-type peptidyl-prolyl cis-trans isomerase 2 protein [Mycoavidus cysteinexigens]GAM51882.1 FKBP-type peptidyl-prolyl cis-trans isomerase SlyD [bacterium endosymbiont of Mortierella elongata FMR23-6]GLR01945.1 FKBP-type peptidyl-prolyl cis-trans isomerase [Mycoavidus cysteinexigens]
MMKIAKNTVVSLSYTLSDAQDIVIEKSSEPMVYLHGEYDGVFPKVEKALEGQELGFETKIQLEPSEAFGDYDAELIRVEPRSRFPEVLEVGMQFEGMLDEDEDGEEDEEEDKDDDYDDEDDLPIYIVTDIADDHVVLDGNHPLAGMALRFELKVINVRAATAEEIDHGHVHGEDGLELLPSDSTDDDASPLLH